MALPTPVFGTQSSLDLLASNFQTVAAIGESTAFRAIETALQAHNDQVQEMVRDFCEVTVDRQRLYGTAQTMLMQELDEHGAAEAQHVTPGALCGFPLRRYGDALQWTRTYFLNATGDELAGQVVGLFDADAQNVIRQIKRSFFLPTNYTDVDRLASRVSQIPLPVKRLVNADGLGLPSGPNGELFDGATHNHYLGVATPGTLADADLSAGLNTLLEHYNVGQARIYINQAQETAVRGMTPNFVPRYDASVIVGQNLTHAVGTLDAVAIYNRCIGTYKGAEVWVKPWMPAGYAFLWLMGAPKPLVWRNPAYVKGDAPNPLGLVYQDEDHPLRASGYDRTFGIGVWNRTNGVVIDVAHSTYNAPAL